ncbi:hypothetical protein MSG28_003150 [Choristoneura fumiferana]|uniref:Uncharacterized protein n=1 Tax=Choristoneura fumiferana TaxID=7141 RepID=A0ACC0KDQ5_CHOFU|nr:hypothetical protein MSG28_003150 [Choristoneura fumiferana]
MPFLGNCTYLASRDRNETGVHKYEVYATNGPCEEKTSAVCTKAVHVVYGKNVIHIRRDPVTKKLVTTIGEEVVYKYPVKKNWVTINSPNKRDVTVELLKAFVELSVQQAKMEFAVRVPSHVYGNATEGLCGVCAGYQEELVTSNGTVTDDFELYGKSWEAAPASLAALALPPQEQCDQPTPEPECVPLPPEDNQCLNLYDKDKFGPCHALVEPEPFAEACEADVCANATDICAALDQYSSACRRQGVCLDWRTKLCPLAW